VMLEFIKPGRPMQNGFIERFNRSYREAVLDMFVFQSLSEVREQTERGLRSARGATTQVSGPSDAQGIFVNPKTRNLW
jgi:transposase InsO family protein